MSRAGTPTDGLKRERSRLQAELRVKQENFVKKEQVFKAKISAQEAELAAIVRGRSAWMDGDSAINDARTQHSEVQAKVSQVQFKTARLVLDQEQDLLKAFRQRLSDVQAELAQEKSGGGEGGGVNAEWASKVKGFEKDADAERARADKEDRLNQALAAEHEELKVSASLQEEDRAYLIKQLVAVKRHNAELRAGLESGRGMLSALLAEAPPTGGGADGRGGAGGALPRAEADTRYKEVLARLTSVLAAERRATGEAEASLASHRAGTTPLELGLRMSVASVLGDKAKAMADKAAAQAALEAAATKAEADEAAAEAERRQLFGGVGSGGSFGGGGATASGAAAASPGEAVDAAPLALSPAGEWMGDGFAHGLGVEALSATERDAALELWLSMDGVIAALVSEKKPSRRKIRRPSCSSGGGSTFLAGGTTSLPPI